MMTILYAYHDNLYVNLTNRCNLACTFCIRQEMDHVGNVNTLWLDREPTVQEVKDEFTRFDMTQYAEVVFCGFGEPTMRLDDLLEIAVFVKETYGKTIRVNTNGQLKNLYGEDVAKRFEGVVDVVSISLNTPNAERYLELTKSKYGMGSFDSMLSFAADVKKYVGKVVLTTVDTTLTKEEEEVCAKICEELGVTYRIRAWGQ